MKCGACLTVLCLSLPSLLDAATPVELRLVELTNRERVAHQLAPLVELPEAAAVAQRHSAEMLSDGAIFHTSTMSGSVEDRMIDTDVFFSKVGENLAKGYDVDLIHLGLMGSEKHRENILDRDYTHLGVGVVSDGGALYVTEVFVALMPRSDGATLAGSIFDRIDASRKEHRLGPLRREELLGQEASRMAAAMLSRDSKNPGDLSAPLSQGYLKIYSFVGSSPVWDLIEAAGLKDWDAIGAGACQGRSKNWPAGANWYVVLFFKNSRP